MFWIHKVIQCSSRHRDHTHTQTYIITRVDKNNGQEQNNFLSHFRPSLTSADQQTDVDLTANYLTAIISLRGRALCTMQASALWPQTANRTNKHFTLSCYAQYIYTHFHWSIPLAVIAINWSVHRFLGLLSDQLLSQSQTLLPAAPQQKLQDDS